MLKIKTKAKYLEDKSSKLKTFDEEIANVNAEISKYEKVKSAYEKQEAEVVKILDN